MCYYRTDYGLMIDISCKADGATMLLRFNISVDSYWWGNNTALNTVAIATDWRCSAKESKIGFIIVVSTHISQWSVFHWHQATVQPKRCGQLNIEFGGKVVGVKFSTDDSRFNLNVTSGVFCHREKGEFKIIPHSFVKDHITDETCWC